MELTEITRDQFYTAVDASILHCKDGANRTKESYQSYDNGLKACALCGLFNNKDLHKHCPLGTNYVCASFCQQPITVSVTTCCDEWNEGAVAKAAYNFPAFHDAHVRLAQRLKAVRERGYEAWRKEHLQKVELYMLLMRIYPLLLQTTSLLTGE